MPNADIAVRQIKGILPALDRKQVQQPFVLYEESKNFLIDLRGPHAFGANRISSYDYIQDSELAQPIRVGDKDFVFTTGCVLDYDVDSGRFFPVYTFIDLGLLWPWYSAELDGKFYFCKRGVGLIQYDPLTSTWTKLTQNVPEDPVSICVTLGRLVCMGVNNTAWSAQDDGTDFAPSTITGAGFQGLSLISGKGKPIGVLPVADGWINYTEKGCFKSEFADGPNPFRHYLLPDSRAVIPINPFCLINDDTNDTNIVLTNKGFYSSTGGPFEQYQQLFSEWLSHNFFAEHKELIDPANSTLLRLWFSQLKKLIILSVANSINSQIYYQAFILYTPANEWGIFNHNHTAFGDLAITRNDVVGLSFGYLDEKGFFHKYIDDVFNEIPPDTAQYDVYWQPYFVIPTRLQKLDTDANPTYIFASLIKIADINEGGLSSAIPNFYSLPSATPIIDPSDIAQLDSDYTSPPIVADMVFENYMNEADQTVDYNLIADGTDDEDYNPGPGQDSWFRFPSSIDMAIGEVPELVIPYVPENQALDSQVSIGLFRFQEAKYDDELGMVTNVAIGVDKIPGPPILEDYMNESPPSEDWNNTSVDLFEDYGSNVVQNTNFSARIIGTLDGKNSFEDQDVELILQEDAGERQYFVGTCTGAYHILKVTALEPNQTFHLKSLDISGTLAGRL